MAKPDTLGEARALCARRAWALLAAALLQAAAGIQIAGPVEARPPLQNCTGLECLAEYVRMPDFRYSWAASGLRRVVSNVKGEATVTVHLLNMTSGLWHARDYVRPSVWHHHMVVAVPHLEEGGAHAALPDFATLYIGIGPPKAKGPEVFLHCQEADDIAELARRTGALAVAAFAVPHQPSVFLDDPKHKKRTEDAIVAYSRRQFLDDPGSPELLVELAETRAVVRAMDTVVAFSRAELPGAPRIRRFGLTGCSKRGLASYFGAAVDVRVAAIAPCNIMLNQEAHRHLVYRSYGAPSFAVSAFQEEGLERLMGTKDYSALSEIVDPVHYQEKLNVPTMAIFASSDRYYALDQMNTWWPKHAEQKHLYIVPNQDHMGTISLILSPVSSFLRGVILEEQMPSLHWDIDNETGAITAELLSGELPKSVWLWQATTCDGRRRDWRMMNADNVFDCLKCGVPLIDGSCLNTHVPWTRQALAPVNFRGRRWVAQVDPPTDGRWRAFYVEFEHEGPRHEGDYWFQSTGVSVVPNVFPFPPCEGQSCFHGAS